jgi:membrane protein
VRGVDDDLEEVGGEAEQALRRHPRVAAMVDLASATLREQSAEQVGLAASGAAFWLVISALPTAIAVVSLFGLAVSPERVVSDLGTLASTAPGSLGALLKAQLRQISVSNHARLSFSVAVSLLLAVWSASAGVWNLDRAIRVAYGLPPQSYLEARARALVGASVVVIMLGLSAIATSTAEARASTLFRVLGVPVELLTVTAAVAVFYRFAIGHPVPLRRLLPGAVTSAIGVLVASVLFGVYVAASTRYTAVYGAFAGVVIVMLAVYLAVYVVLLGAVLNMQLSRSQPKTDEHLRRPG